MGLLDKSLQGSWFSCRRGRRSRPGVVGTLALASLALGALALATSCQRGEEEAPTSGEPAATVTFECAADAGTTPQLDCPVLPNTTATGQPGYDYFAWNSFIALSWPAIVPADNNEQRGFPSRAKGFVDAASSDLLVWETYLEKRELFFHDVDENPGPWNKPVHYGGPPPESPKHPLEPLDPPPCPGFPEEIPSRLLATGLKAPFDSLDESVEVASEALEMPEDLCKGYSSDPQCGTPNAHPCCQVFGQPVGPRVWQGTPDPTGEPVLYEVKINWDYYDFVVRNGYYLDSNALAAANDRKIQLPYRTSAQKGPSGAQSANTAVRATPTINSTPQKAPPAVTSYDVSDCVSLYESITPTGDATPCPSGAVQLKAGWKRLGSGDDPSKFHTAEALYFRVVDGQTCMDVGTFGLVGFHIIQRVHQGTGAQAQPGGGTFVFATWEHTDNDTAGFTYSNYLKYHIPTGPPPDAGFYPKLPTTLTVTRKFQPLSNTQQVNQAVHDAISERNRDSVWLNYRLIGTQFQAIDVEDQPGDSPPFPPGPNDPTGIGQPLYLANLVIETNEGLQHFQGQPPGLTTSVYSNVPPNDGIVFERGMKNVSSGGTGYNMGGCMGCHGVAQIRGYSFSFVLQDGQEGAGIDTNSDQNVDVPPIPRN